jgi:hypothetical protein
VTEIIATTIPEIESMADDEILSQDEHRRIAVELFNYVWTLIDKPELTQSEIDTMIHAAHASRYHWGQAGTPFNLARGEWQISRVYAALNRADQARYHAQRCLDICLEYDIGDFDLAFAYEALARAAAVAHSLTETQHYLSLAVQAAGGIADDDDRALLWEDLNTIPGFNPE